MEYKEVPSDHEVVLALQGLDGKATARDLCDALVDAGHPRRDSQLAIQRAVERGHLTLEADWKLSLPNKALAA